MIAAAMDPSKSTVHGPGLSKAVAGIPAVLQIKAMDCYGNRRTTGAHPAPQIILPCWYIPRRIFPLPINGNST